MNQPTPSEVSDAPPGLAGWRVDFDSRGVWIATRRGTLTAEQMRYGVPLQVLASTFGELEVKAVAADVHATMVATAERLAVGMVDAELKRRQDERDERPSQ